MIDRIASLTAAALLAGASLAGAGSISGTAKISGKAPMLPPTKLNSQPYCVPFHPTGLPSESYVVSATGGLKNVIIYVKGATGGTAKTEPVVLSQKGCQYMPHVVAVQAGEPVRVTNDDETMHNIHGMATINKPFNNSQPKKGGVKDFTFDKEEFIRVKCDVHGWMSSFIGVFSHPFFAVTGEDGSFKIDGLPAGTYDVEAWHEKMKILSQKVTVGPGDAKVTFTFAAK